MTEQQIYQIVMAMISTGHLDITRSDEVDAVIRQVSEALAGE